MGGSEETAGHVSAAAFAKVKPNTKRDRFLALPKPANPQSDIIQAGSR
jgi:hypothetical protein